MRGEICESVDLQMKVDKVVWRRSPRKMIGAREVREDSSTSYLITGRNKLP